MTFGRKLVFSASLAAMTAGGVAIAQDSDDGDENMLTIAIPSPESLLK